MNDLIEIHLNAHPVAAERGARLFDVIERAAVPIATACGGRGICQLCRVQITAGLEHASPATLLEKSSLGNASLALGWRLACQVQVQGPMSVEVPAPRKKMRVRPAAGPR